MKGYQNGSRREFILRAAVAPAVFSMLSNTLPQRLRAATRAGDGRLARFAAFLSPPQAIGKAPEIVAVQKIWDKAPHSAFTDLTRFREQWFCTFREGKGHGGDNGKIRVLTSENGESWKSAALLAEAGVDLRDPHFSITPDRRLMLSLGGTILEDSKHQTRAPRVAFSRDGREWTVPRRVLAEGHWIWQVSWHKGQAYGVSYLGEDADRTRCHLYTSRDGIDWKWVTKFEMIGANEVTLRFLPGDEMMALVRPNWLGSSRPPYKQWTWHELKYKVGGPNFIRLPDGSLWGAGRQYHPDGSRTTVVARMTRDSYEPVLTLPSGGDTSYPGLVWHEDLLWMSYYSSHEEKTSIYLAKIKFRG